MIALVWVEAIAIARVTGSKGTAIGIVQFPPTLGLLVCLAVLIDIGSADFGPAANDNASGVAVALALARALDAAPPRNAAVEIVLTGAGDGSGIGLRRYLRVRRKKLTQRQHDRARHRGQRRGSPRWWVSDGPLVPLAYFPQLKELSATLARNDPELGARPTEAGARRRPTWRETRAAARDHDRLPRRTRRRSPLAPARRTHPSASTKTRSTGAVEFGLMLVDAIDAFLRPPRASRTESSALPGPGTTAPLRR